MVSIMDSLTKNNESEELLEAQAHIWNHIFNFINSMSLKCAVELGIPDTIDLHGKPMTLTELINELPINHTKSPYVYRLMRILIHSGFFKTEKISAEEGYLLSPACKLLLKDERTSVSPFLLAVLDPILTNPWHQLSLWFQKDDVNDETTPFAITHGKTFWDMAGHIPTMNNFFNEAMASDARLVSRVLIEDYKHVFEGCRSFVDVGGGTGAMAMAVADAFPQLKCIVLDLPHVVDGLNHANNNLEFVAGDMFKCIPPADVVLLKWILHDWSDEECVKILKKCKEAIPEKVKGGKIMIIDMVLNNENKVVKETQLCYDMLMMVLITGRERTEEEWAHLFFNAGFSGYKITPMFGLRSLIEVFYLSLILHKDHLSHTQGVLFKLNEMMKLSKYNKIYCGDHVIVIIIEPS